MNLDSFTGPGSTPSRRRFWDKITSAVNASQKVQGDNVSVDEHEGMGTLINVSNSNRRSIPSGATGACCIGTDCSVLSAADCATAGGVYQGDGVPCDPNPCCSDCTNLYTPFDDGDGNCFSRPECDGSFSDPVSCDSRWLTLTEFCCDTSSICQVLQIDRFTCVETEIVPSTCDECTGPIGTLVYVTNEIPLCPTLSPPP